MAQIVTWAQLREAIRERAINDREEKEKTEIMEGWCADGYSAEWTARRMGYQNSKED